ncbi:MAG: hypothetical protein DSY80_06355 [Desulfocapsa sp.]|nr:MAG: hypothetical protein DSY80_06355 [Desulfocapsa sp.]
MSRRYLDFYTTGINPEELLDIHECAMSDDPSIAATGRLMKDIAQIISTWMDGEVERETGIETISMVLPYVLSTGIYLGAAKICPNNIKALIEFSTILKESFNDAHQHTANQIMQRKETA